MMQTQFQQLSTHEQFRVYRLLAKGETVSDPELAAITLETAGHFRSQNRVKARVFRWAPMVLALCLAIGALPGAVEGQVGGVLFLLFILLSVVANLMLNPWTRPKNVVKSMEASRRVVASHG
jgi:hypothetical protein